MNDNPYAPKRSAIPCRICGVENYSVSFCDGAEKTRMDRDGICFSCAFWELRAERGCQTVIDGVTYQPGHRTDGPMRGMGGRRFDIEYFDGRVISTVDLWCGGVVPDRWRKRIPDTARFLNGARSVKVGETIYFDSSEEK